MKGILVNKTTMRKLKKKKERTVTHFKLGSAQVAEKELSQEGVYHKSKNKSLRVNHLKTQSNMYVMVTAHRSLSRFITRASDKKSCHTREKKLTVILGLDLVM